MLDHKFTSKELNYVNQFYSRFLDNEKRSDLIWLLGMYKKNNVNLMHKLKGNLILEAVISGINLHFSIQHKNTLIYYLFELAESDREISNKELKFIFRLATSISLSKSEINTITSLYFSSYIPFPDVKFKKAKKSSKKSYKKKKARTVYVSKSKLENALEIFNLTKNASNKEIKEAYKKLVRKHHPDRVNHLGEEHVLKATEIFKKINVAYDYLSQVKGIV